MVIDKEWHFVALILQKWLWERFWGGLFCSRAAGILVLSVVLRRM
jgi:hypothetical protein